MSNDWHLFSHILLLFQKYLSPKDFNHHVSCIEFILVCSHPFLNKSSWPLAFTYPDSARKEMINPLDNEPASSCNDAGCLVSGATGRSSGIATTEDNLLQSGSSADEDLELQLKKAITQIEELKSRLEARSTSNVIADDTEQRKEKILQELKKTQSQLAILRREYNDARNKHRREK